MNNSEEVKDIAIIYKLKRNYGTLEYVPYKVVIGTYDGEEEELIDEHGTPYHHIIEGNTYGFAARKSLAEYNKQFPLLPLVVIKTLILHYAKKYKYKLNQFSDECTPMINFYDKDKYSKESILLDRDILVFYITYYPEVLSEIEEEFGIKITYEKQIEEPKNENQTKLQVTNKEKENKIDINVNKLYTEITKNVIDQNEPIKKILTAIWKQYNNFSTNKSRNILINGSTGVGKTEIFRQLTKNVNIPCYIANATEYTASGYVGRDVSEMLKSLLDITNGDLEKAEKGILIIDELDKLSETNKTQSQVNQKDVQEALLKIEPKQLDQLLHPNFDDESLKAAKVIATGLAASPGAATGKLCFTAEDVIKMHNAGEKDLILARLETSPEDIEGMNLAHGILTVRGGMTSHAAVVARGMGTCCVSGCGSIIVDEQTKTLTAPDGTVYKEGDYISLDGATGNVYGEKIKTVEPDISGDFETIMNWADEVRKLQIRTNADTPRDALQARKFGAEGIGLCRTEHMFFEEERIFNFRRMITADSEKVREEALEKILPYQRDDFEGLFRAMDGYTVTIRFLDPPLHEFLPHTEEEIIPLAKSLGMTTEALKNRVESLKEFNPMMGHRGCRLAITYPEIARMQTRAVIEAAINVKKEGKTVIPEIMIPLIGTVNELKYVKNIVVKTAEEIIKETGVDLKYEVGTMIEIPRAALTADEIAKEAEFFSFGTNDLTQMTFGFSRDDASKFLNDYYKKKILEQDPFATIDQEGVGKLVAMAAELGRKTRPSIHLGICGEHGGDPKSIEFCHKIGLNYVSCSPFRVPLARLAAAQAAIKSGTNK